MKSQYMSMPLTDISRQSAHVSGLMRAAMQRELESEMRGLIMAARLHGFKLEITGDNMTCRATMCSSSADVDVRKIRRGFGDGAMS